MAVAKRKLPPVFSRTVANGLRLPPIAVGINKGLSLWGRLWRRRGAGPMPQLTKKTVDALKGPGRCSDGDGLYLEVSANGAKSWILRVTVQGRRRDIGLGGLFWVSLVDAREEARKLRKVARKGGDPVGERKAEQGIPTLEQAARDLYDKLKPGWRKVGVHVKHWISSLERDVFPTLGDRPINTITSGNILSVLTPI